VPARDETAPASPLGKVDKTGLLSELRKSESELKVAVITVRERGDLFAGEYELTVFDLGLTFPLLFAIKSCPLSATGAENLGKQRNAGKGRQFRTARAGGLVGVEGDEAVIRNGVRIGRGEVGAGGDVRIADFNSGPGTFNEWRNNFLPIVPCRAFGDCSAVEGVELIFPRLWKAKVVFP
jgi:hypothetical protein